MFGKKAERGAARDKWFAQEEAFRNQENWNLLYVAATRARQLLIISGAHTGKDDDGGVKLDSWYERLLSVAEFEPAPAFSSQEDATGHFALPLFQPTVFPLPTSVVEPDNQTTLEGKRLHALMERLTAPGTWPITMPSVQHAAH